MTDAKELKITLALSMLQELGINLYSNNPAVLSEAIANAWDADAKKVAIRIDTAEQKITISDDGVGMTREDVIDKYLTVGYHKRQDSGGESAGGRAVMGRKGIGKLALFSIANTIEVHTVKGGEKTAFIMREKDIREQIKNAPSGVYKPEEISADVAFDFEHGTKIILSDMKKKLKDGLEQNIRTRTARRFMVIFGSHEFEVSVNDKPVTISDRGYWNKMEMLWLIGDTNQEGHFVQQMRGLLPEGIFDAAAELNGEVEWTDENGRADSGAISGWIGTAKRRAQMRDEDGGTLNKLIVMARGKLAHEDVLPICDSAKIGVEYIVGEVYADFLDLDDERYSDISVSSRQGLIEDEPRVVATMALLKKHVETISAAWILNREKKGLDIALQVPEIKQWYDAKSSDAQKVAKKLFGDVNKSKSDNQEETAKRFQVCVMAVESMDTLGKLSELESFTVEKLDTLGELFEKLDFIEAGLWYEITRARISTIEQLNAHVRGNDYEALIQRHIFDHLWLLDPSWDHATDLEKYLEEPVIKAFDDVKKSETEQQQGGRVDIRCKTAADKHIIIELKRPGVSVTTRDLCAQMDKYHDALAECLTLGGKSANNIECVAILGKPLTDTKTETQKSRSDGDLKTRQITVVYYDQLIQRAGRQYQQYFNEIEQTKKAKKIAEKIYKAIKQASPEEDA